MRDSQTVPAATFDHFFFFFFGLAVRFFLFFFFFFHWFGLLVFRSGLFIYLFFILALESLGTEKKKFLSDEN